MEENKQEIQWTENRTWKEFRETRLLWWVNTMLHMFGWAIGVEVDDNGEIIDAIPMRVKYRGFNVDINTEGYQEVSKYLKENASDLYDETMM